MPWVSARIVGVYKAFDNVGVVSAGLTQNILCATTVQLEGSVTGDVSKHVVEWEQLSGTAVTLNDPTTLTPWFVNPNTTDFIFRLWIDRYTAYEKYDDVYISREPSDFAATLISGNDTFLDDANTSMPITVGELSMTSTSGMGVIEPVTASVSSAWVEPTMYADQIGTYLPSGYLSNNTAMVRWRDPVEVFDTTTPASVQLSAGKEYFGTFVQKFNTTSSLWETVAFVAVGGHNYYNLLNGGVYRLVASWQRYYLKNSLEKVYTKKEYVATSRVFVGRIPVGAASVNSSLASLIAAQASGTATVERFTFTKKTQLATDNATNLPNSAVGYDVTAINRYSGLVAPDVEEDLAPALPNTAIIYADTLVITRTSGASIG